MLRFTYGLGVPPTKNQAEHNHPAKAQQKIYGRLCSETTTKHRYAVRGYLFTATNHGADVRPQSKTPSGRPGVPPNPAAAWPDGPPRLPRNAISLYLNMLELNVYLLPCWAHGGLYKSTEEE